jgi:integration host factor subunit beta
MTKAEIVERVAMQTQLPQQQVAAILEGVVQCIMEALRSGDTVELRGFGSFRCRHRRPRTGRNPKTGVAVQVPAQRIPAFKASQAVYARLNALAADVPPRAEGEQG